MTTLRIELNEAEFDWENGRILWQPDGDGWGEGKKPIEEITSDHPIFDEEFDGGYGAPEMPSFFAEDNENIYFPGQYDGATWVAAISKHLFEKVGEIVRLPYVGG